MTPRIKKTLLSSFVLTLVLAVIALNVIAGREAQAYKNPLALSFEKNAALWLSSPATPETLQTALRQKQVKEIAVSGQSPDLVLVTLKDNVRFSTRLPNCNQFSCNNLLAEALAKESVLQGFPYVRVDVDARTPAQRALSELGELKPLLFSVITMGALLVLLLKLQAGDGGTKELASKPSIRFSDVIGADSAKKQLTRVKVFLSNPKQYTQVGARAPRGVLLVGPPGTGKTLLARALAGETGANFIQVDGSYFTSMFFGAGVSKVKGLFKFAKAHAPCVLFIDEIDGIGRRSAQASTRGAADSEANRIINRILVEMDGFEPMTNVIVMGATNHESNIDEALRRAGRFDSIVRLGLPTLHTRQSLFDMYLNRVKIDQDVQSTVLAKLTAGASPADIENLVNSAAALAAEAGKTCVAQLDLTTAIENLRLGGEVSDVKGLLTEDTRKRLAAHEAGHAVVAHYSKAGDVEHVSIEPRGQALGVTYVERALEEPLYSKEELQARLAMMLGGRQAELLVTGGLTSGAADDLKKATELAYRMVASFGFSDKLGVISVEGIPAGQQSEELRNAIAQEVTAYLATALSRANAILDAHREQLDALLDLLIEHEVVTKPMIRAVLAPL